MPEFFGELTEPLSSSMTTPGDTVREVSDPLHLSVDDETLVRVIDERINASESWYNKVKKLKERRERNRNYLFGNQLDESQLKYYNARYVDNIGYEAMGTIKPIALSRLPDLLVKAGSEDEFSKDTAKDLTKLVNSDIRKRENRSVLGLSFRHLPVYFIGAIKAVWDREYNDYRFKVVHPENLVLDHTASSCDPSDMNFIAEKVEMTVKEAIMTFPDKEQEILFKVGFEKDKRHKDSKLASPIKIWEVWFKWPKATEDPATGEKKWEMINGVIWKFKDLILKKMKNPYWDWEGKRKLFIKEMGKKREATEDEMISLMFGGELETENVYRNHFDDPQFPYIFMGYDQWGEMPLDETSALEQIIPLQDNVNKRGKQITEMNDRAKGKHVFSTEGGIEKKTIEEMDMNNPNEDILVEGDVTKVHTFIPGQPAPAQLYKEQEQERQKAFAKLKTHSTTRGEKTTDVATTNQILRESDFGGIDDMVNETINPAAEKMAAWAMQFIRMFYTVDHVRKILGKDGEMTMMRINQDTIEDGMEVVVSASGVDKIQSRKEAFERARMQLTDPLTFFEDTDVADPIGRTERLIVFMSSPELYMQKYVKKRNIREMEAILQQQPIQGNGVQKDAAMFQQPTNVGGGGAPQTPQDQWLQKYGGGSSTFHKTN